MFTQGNRRVKYGAQHKSHYHLFIFFSENEILSFPIVISVQKNHNMIFCMTQLVTVQTLSVFLLRFAVVELRSICFSCILLKDPCFLLFLNSRKASQPLHFMYLVLSICLLVHNTKFQLSQVCTSD